MRTLAGQRQVRAFEVQPEQPRHAFGQRLAGGGDGGAGDLGRIGDQRGQERGGAAGRMALADRADGLDAGGVVQHHAAATIDLKIDKTRRDQPARERHPLDPGGQVGLGLDRGDPACVDQQGAALVAVMAVEDVGAEIGLGRGHIVSVTFLRLRGRSGLPPRSAARRSTKA